MSNGRANSRLVVSVQTVDDPFQNGAVLCSNNGRSLHPSMACDQRSNPKLILQAILRIIMSDNFAPLRNSEGFP